MATPVFRTLRKNFPDAKIYAGIRPYGKGVLLGSPRIDEIVAMDDSANLDLFKLGMRIRKERFDIGILLTNSPRGLIPLLLGGVKKIYGWRRGLQKYFVHGPEPEFDGNGRIKAIPMTDYYMEICRHMELDIGDGEASHTELFTDPGDEMRVEKALASEGILDGDPILCMNPGARFGSSKCWPPEFFAKFAELASKEFPFKTVLVSGPGEEELAKKILSLCPVKIPHFGKFNLSELKSFIKRVSILLSNDTGPRHFATAFSVPTLVLLGPTDMAYTAYGLDVTRFLKLDLECAPCHLKSCPTEHRCMRMINPEMAVAELKKMLSESGFRKKLSFAPKGGVDQKVGGSA